MEKTAPRPDIWIGLAVAGVLHVALFWALHQYGPDAPQPEEEREPPPAMTVSFGEEFSELPTAPVLAPAPQVAMAPEIGESLPPPPIFDPLPAPVPRSAVLPPAESTPIPAARPDRTSTRTPPRSQPSSAPASRANRRNAAPAASKSAAKSATRSNSSSATTSSSSKRGGGAVGADFLDGMATGSANSGGAPAAGTGPSSADLNSIIARKIKPHWSAPQGVDTEKLVTIVAWSFNQDGSISGTPRCTSQSGVTPSNEAQKSVHCERAIRAVQLAAPFPLPAEYYAKWRRVNDFRFDRRL